MPVDEIVGFVAKAGARLAFDATVEVVAEVGSHDNRAGAVVRMLFWLGLTAGAAGLLTYLLGAATAGDTAAMVGVVAVAAIGLIPASLCRREVWRLWYWGEPLVCVDGYGVHIKRRPPIAWHRIAGFAVIEQPGRRALRIQICGRRAISLACRDPEALRLRLESARERFGRS